MGDKVVNIQERISQYWLGQCEYTAGVPPLRGRLIPFPVGGIGYRTATQRGHTTSRGEFCFLPGERITFFIGAVEFPATTASATVTPYDLGSMPNEPINVMRFLYSVIDEREGVLEVAPSVAQLASRPLDFAIAPATFARQPELVRLLEQLARPLVDDETVVDRLDASIARYIYSTYLDVAVTLWFRASPASDYTRSLNAD